MSTLNVANVTDGTTSVPTGYVVNGSAKTWVNFNGTGTIATRDSMNVSSLTDNDTGYYTVSSTNSFDNSNYSTSISCNREVTTNWPVNQHALTVETGYVLVLLVRYDNSAWSDSNLVFVQNFGDLA